MFPMAHGITVSNPTSPSLRRGQNTSCGQADAHQQTFRSGAEQALFSKPLINTDTGLHTEAVSSPSKEEKRPSVRRFTKYRKTTRTAASVLREKVQCWRRKRAEDFVSRWLRTHVRKESWPRVLYILVILGRKGLKRTVFQICFKKER